MTAASGRQQRQCQTSNGPKLTLICVTWMVRQTRCVHCLSLAHKSSQCSWGASDMMSSNSWAHPRGDFRSQSNGICRSWKRDPRPRCSFSNCKYQHICAYCARKPARTDRSHKAVLCPYRPTPFSTGFNEAPPST